MEYELRLMASAAPRRRDDWRRFSLWLPLFSVVTWITLVAEPILVSFLEIFSSEGIYTGGGPVYELMMAFHYGTARNSHLLQGFNNPGVWADLLLSLPMNGPKLWYPQTMPSDDWRAFVWPFLCCPFWWLAGVGLEGLVGFRRLRWPLLTVGTLLTLFYVGICCGFLLDPEMRGNNGVDRWIIWGFGFWALLFAAFPASWIRNRRKKLVAA